jgi:PTS system glucitol/sorbitol-specific IIA component
MYLETEITAIGPEAAEMAEGGIVILFADGAPPELAEVSVLHKTAQEPSDAEPPIGSSVRFGALQVKITGIGPTAWAKMKSMGHIVFAFNGGDGSDRPGEICVTEVPLRDLLAQLKAGNKISVG